MIDGTSAKQLNLSNITEVVSSSITSMGWKRYSAGESSEINYNDRFDLYIRRRKLSDLVSSNDDILKKSSNVLKITSNENASKINASENFLPVVSNAPMGNPQKDMTPSPILPITKGSEKLPVLSGFSNYPSLAAARTESPALVIAFDSEWYYLVVDGQTCRNILSWQFSLIDGEDLVEYVFIICVSCHLYKRLALKVTRFVVFCKYLYAFRHFCKILILKVTKFGILYNNFSVSCHLYIRTNQK